MALKPKKVNLAINLLLGPWTMNSGPLNGFNFYLPQILLQSNNIQISILIYPQALQIKQTYNI